MIAGEFDLSAGVMTGVTAIVMGLIINNWHWNAWLAIVGAFVFAAFVGLVNGVVVTVTKLPSFIVTLATFFILRGISVGGVLRVNHGSTQVTPRRPERSRDELGPQGLRQLLRDEPLASERLPDRRSSGSSASRSSPPGSWRGRPSETGSSRRAATRTPSRNVGVPVARTKILMFLATALCGALVGVIQFSQAASAVSEQGVGYEFYYIIAAVVGGCFLTGGYGSAIGAAIGACIIGMAFEGVIYAGWDSSWDFAFLGVILLLAVLVNTFVYRRAMRARR